MTTMTIYHWVAKRGLKQLEDVKSSACYDEGQLLVWAKFNPREVVNTDYLSCVNWLTP